MAVVRIGELLDSRKAKKKSDGEEYIIFDGLSREIVYFFRRANSSFDIIRNSAKYIDRDNRKSILEIRHNVKKAHKLSLVVDLSGLCEDKFHFNLTNDSRKVITKCSTCRKYFNCLDHLIFSARKKDVPIISADELWKVIRNKLNPLFNKYKCDFLDKTLL